MEESKQWKAQEELSMRQEKNWIFEAELVSDSMPDTAKMRKGQTFVKTWTFKNTGKSTWPEGIRLVMRSGDNFIVDQSDIEGPIHPGSDCHIKATFKAPDRTGKFVTYFRLSTETGS